MLPSARGGGLNPPGKRRFLRTLGFLEDSGHVSPVADPSYFLFCVGEICSDAQTYEDVSVASAPDRLLFAAARLPDSTALVAPLL